MENPLDELLNRLNRQLRTVSQTRDRGLGTDAERFEFGGSGTGLDLTDAGDAFVLAVDVPGFEPDDVEIELAGTTLSITGHRSDQRNGSDDTYLRRERRDRSFNRRISLPERVDADDADATLNNGVLTIHLPKQQPDDRARSIDIE